VIEWKKATIEYCEVIIDLYEELMREIGDKTNTEPKLTPKAQSIELCKHYLECNIYTVFVAEADNEIIGFLSLCPSHSLYAGGEFGVIQEFFVRPAYRSNKVGATLLAKAVEYANQVGWKRLEVATPPLPQFERSFLFYKKNRFVDGEGRKMRLVIE
jgi:GNAT superfamily N-acetyltransferase